MRIIRSLTLAASVSTLSLLATGTALAAQRPLPLDIYFGGFAQTTSGPTGNPPYVTIHGTAVGNGNFFGLSTAAFDQTIVFGNPNQITNGTFTFTAADGSTLSATYYGPLAAFNQYGLTIGDGFFSITGGTGRFAGACGNGVYEVDAQQFPPGSDPGASVRTHWQGQLYLNCSPPTARKR